MEEEVVDLKTAVMAQDTEKTLVFLSKGQDPNAIYEIYGEEETLLHFAIMRGNLELVKVLTEGGADYSRKIFDHRNLCVEDYLLDAIRAGQTEIIKYLLDHGCDLNDVPSAPGYVYQASYYLDELEASYSFAGNYDDMLILIRLFLDLGCRVNKKTLESLMFRHFGGHEREVYELIIPKCEDINEIDQSGRSMLHTALTEFKNQFAFQKECVPADQNANDIFLDTLLEQPEIDVNLIDDNDCTPLYYACQFTTDRIVLKLLALGADISELNTKDSESAAYAAIKSQKPEILKGLLTYGIDTEIAAKSGETLLHCACRLQNEECIRLLVDAGANVMAYDNQMMTPLHYLVLEQKPKTNQLIDLLLDAGADIDAMNSAGRTPFFVSAMKTNNQFMNMTGMILKHLSERGAMTDIQDDRGNTPLHYAIQDGDMNRFRLLLSMGADPNVKNSSDISPYQMALQKNQRSLISMIEKATAQLNLDEDDCDQAFFEACRNGRRATAQLLMKTGNIDVTYTDNMGRTSLFYIAKLGMTALAKFVIEQGVDVNYRDNQEQTALHFAAGSRQQEVFKMLLENGADIEAADSNGVYPIHLVTNRGQANLLKLLLSYDADTSVMTNQGESLLMTACYTRSKECVKLLLDAGLDPNQADNHGLVPAFIAVRNNQKDMLGMLADSGADLFATEKDGSTLIHVAASKGYREMIRELAGRGLSVDAKDDFGIAPVHIAVKNQDKDTFKLLLDLGADYTCKTSDGESCLSIATDQGQKEIIELMAIYDKRRANNKR